VSSIPLKPWLLEVLTDNIKPQKKEGEYLLCIASEKQSGEGESVVHATCVDVIPGYFSGVGDLFSALCLGHYHYHPTSSVSSPSQTSSSSSSVITTTRETRLSHAVSLSLLKTHSLLTLTHSYTLTLPPEEREPTDDEKDGEMMERRTRRMRGRELRVVQGAGVLMKKEMAEFDEGERMRMRMKKWEGFWESNEQ
jgi:pyridoxine kinase